MKIEKIKISREVQIGSKWVAVEASLDENENAIEGLAELDKTIYDYLLRSGQTYEYNPEPKVINRAYERMEMIISDCKTLEELAIHKDYANKHPDLMPIYMNRLKQIQNV